MYKKLLRTGCYSFLIVVFACSPLVSVHAQEKGSSPVLSSETQVSETIGPEKTVDTIGTPVELPPAPKDTIPIDPESGVDAVPADPTATVTPVPTTGGTTSGSGDPKGSGENETMVTFTQPFNPENLTAGLTAANHKAAEVNKSTGALTYSYPITVPPGRNNIQPDIALEYNNQQAGNYSNIFGYGWAISIPYIDRINKTGVDKLYTANYFNSSLSGELVEISTGVYMPKVENGSFIKYEYDGTMWILTDKHGTVYKFGTNDTERQDDSSHTNTYKWMLEEVRDTNDNYISYTYTKDNGQIYPDTIIYTGNGTTAGIFEVIFHTISRSDATTSYATGFLVETNYLIEQIEVSVNGNWVRKYDLDFIAGDNGNRSLLGSIIETGQDSTQTTTTPLEPISFTYSTSTAGWSFDSTTYDAPMPFGNGYQSMPDFNGDAWPDVIESWYDNSSSNGVETSLHDTHDYWNSLSGLASPIYFRFRETRGGGSSDVWDQGVRIGDINGDLLPDILKSEDNANANGGFDAYLNTGGSSWTQDSNWYPTVTLNGDNNINTWGSHFIDLNGDGLTDIIRKYSGNEAQINIGTGFDTATTSWDPPVDLAGPMSQFADVNNDGLPDIIYMAWVNPNQVKSVYLNGGDGTWIQDNSWIPPVDTTGNTNNNDYGARFFDVNGDGLVDQVPQYIYSYAGQHTYLNTGTGWVQAPSAWDVQNAPSNPAVINFTGDPINIADVNADGSLDFFSTQNSVVYTTYAYLNNTEFPPDMLTGIEFPESGTTAITYKRSTQYRDGSGDILNPNLPIPLDTVHTITTTDPITSLSSAIEYSYQDGHYFYDSATNRKFAGFAIVSNTDPENNVTKTYFHQGDPGNTDYESIGDIDDSEWKIGKPYRVEKYDGSGNLYEVAVNTWGEDTIGTNGAKFVHQDAVTTFAYNGDTSSRDTMDEFTYDTDNGNPLTHLERGEVTANNDGSLSADVGTDDRLTVYEYAIPVGTPSVYGLPSHKTVTDNSSAVVSESNYYYDGLSLGDVEFGNLTSQQDRIDGSTWATTGKHYDGTYGLVDQTTDANNKNTNYVYDSENLYPETVTDPENNSVDYTYDYASGKVTVFSDMNNLDYTTTYDGFGRPLSVSTPDPTGGSGQVQKTDYVYDDTSIPNSVHATGYLDGSTTVDIYSYVDGLGRQKQVRTEAENPGDYNVRTFAYDGNGRLASESLPYTGNGSDYDPTDPDVAYLTSYAYDPLGRVLSSTNAAGLTGYEYGDWQTSVTDANGHIKTYYNDAYDNLIKVDEIDTTNTATYTTNYEWNLNGKLTKITDDLGNFRDFTYDHLGRRLSAQDLHASGDTSFGSWGYEYDDNGNLTQSIDPRGKQIDYVYDDAGRLTSENHPTSAGTDITYAYDSCTNGAGKLCAVTMTTGADSAYTYDKTGNIASDAKTISSTAYTTWYSYDRQGNPTLITMPDSKQTRYTYNTAGLLDKVEFKPATIFTTVVNRIKHSPMDQITSMDYANTVQTVSMYDPFELYRLKNRTTSDGITDFQNIDYLYDHVGNITQIADNSVSSAGKTVDYTYDDLDRLLTADTGISAANSQDYSETFTYNSIGNILTGPFGTYSYNGHTSTYYANPHAVTSAGGNSYTYDNSGNVTNDGTNAYTYNYKNQLVQTVTPSKTITYLYDHSGTRMKSDDGTIKNVTPTKFYDKEIGTGAVNDYIYADSQLIASFDGAYHYVHPDHLMGSNVITDSYPKEEQLLDYYPYGDIRINQQQTSLDLKKKYTGHEYDTDTDLNYMGARYYEAKRGQFLSQDNLFRAIGGNTEQYGKKLNELLMNPQSLNSYSYALNNPLKNIDPDGNVSISALLFNPLGTLPQLGFWSAGSQFLSSSRPASAALIQHSLSLNPSNITINQGNQSNYGNIVDQIKNSSEFKQYLNTALSGNKDAVFSEGGVSGSLQFTKGDLSTSLGKAQISISGSKDSGSINVQVKDLYNYEMHANPSEYKGSKFFTTLNNLANVSQSAGTISPYNTTINFSTLINNDDKK